MALRFLALAALSMCAACSSADFGAATTDAAIATDTGAAATDSGASIDDGGGGPDAADDDTGSVIGAEAGSSDSSPGCDTTPPPFSCTLSTTAYAPDFEHRVSGWLSPRINLKTAHAISYVTARDGRHEKLIIGLRRLPGALPTGLAGRVTVAAFRTPCPGVNLPIGNPVSMDATAISETGGEYAFYFRDEDALPPVPHGTRLTFVITTDSAIYEFDLRGGSPVGPPPPSLEWYVREGTGEWTKGSGSPSASPWIRACAG